MITLAFLICLPSGHCTQQAVEQVFRNEAACHAQASVILENVAGMVANGRMPDHASSYQCIQWGNPV